MPHRFSIELQQVTKRYGQETVLENLNLRLDGPASVALLGANGSGKSTLLQILAGYIQPGKGKLNYYLDDQLLAAEHQFRHIAYCAPYLDLIEEMTLKEFLQYHFSFKPARVNINEMPAMLGLEKAENKMLHQLSSGMKQRVKLAQAIFADTPLLLLDEPCTNLDEDGYALYQQLLTNHATERLLVVASNDPREYAFCHLHLQVSEYKSAAHAQK